MPKAVRYNFTQRFPIPADLAYAWCTDFSSEDQKLMGERDALREVTRLSEGTVILTDTFQTSAGKAVKQKLVALYPQQLSWTSTHLSGPHKHSQFLYQITSEGKDASVLHFTALHLEFDEKVDVQALAVRLCAEDAAAWKLLAAAMMQELTSP